MGEWRVEKVFVHRPPGIVGTYNNFDQRPL
jgi:hypothetical protein